MADEAWKQGEDGPPLRRVEVRKGHKPRAVGLHRKKRRAPTQHEVVPRKAAHHVALPVGSNNWENIAVHVRRVAAGQEVGLLLVALFHQLGAHAERGELRTGESRHEDAALRLAPPLHPRQETVRLTPPEPDRVSPDRLAAQHTAPPKAETEEPDDVLLPLRRRRLCRERPPPRHGGVAHPATDVATPASSRHDGRLWTRTGRGDQRVVRNPPEPRELPESLVDLPRQLAKRRGEDRQEQRTLRAQRVEHAAGKIGRRRGGRRGHHERRKLRAGERHLSDSALADAAPLDPTGPHESLEVSRPIVGHARPQNLVPNHHRKRPPRELIEDLPQSLDAAERLPHMLVSQHRGR